MNVLDSMVGHFENQAIAEVEVPEWGTEGEPLVIYFKPFTLAEQKKLYSMAKDDNMEMLAYTLILKALDKEGEKIFGMGDKLTLMNKVDPYVLARVVNSITASSSMEDQLGN